jgi:hypothetical protein
MERHERHFTFGRGGGSILLLGGPQAMPVCHSNKDGMKMKTKHETETAEFHFHCY